VCRAAKKFSVHLKGRVRIERPRGRRHNRREHKRQKKQGGKREGGKTYMIRKGGNKMGRQSL